MTILLTKYITSINLKRQILLINDWREYMWDLPFDNLKIFNQQLIRTRHIDKFVCDTTNI
jgi:hypothetical protein